MTRYWLGAALVTITVAGCTPQSPEQQFIDDALTAVGGRAKVEQVKTIVVEANGINYNLGQDMKPEASTQQFAVSGYMRKIDVESGRQRVEQTRTPKFAYFQGPQPQTQVFGLDGDVAFNVSPDGKPNRTPAGPERDRRVDFLHYPITALRAAIAPVTTVANVRNAGASRQADFTFRDRQFTLTIDAAGLPLSVSSKTYHPNLGDVVMTTTFAQYEDVDGLKLPTRISGKVDDFTTYELTTTKNVVDADIGDVTAPQSVQTPVNTPTVNVTAEPIGKGVWLLAGQSHHSALVEFSDHLMLIEAPQSEPRAPAR
jgi:hypothetical protein